MKIKGKLSVTSKGFGFLRTKAKEDIFIPKKHIKDAIDEDIVEVQISGRKHKGPEGFITKIIHRTKKLYIATITHKNTKSYKALLSLPGKEQIVTIFSSKKLQKGDRIEIKMISWKKLQGEFLKYFGNIQDPSIDTKVALKEFGIKKNFSENVQKELQKIKNISKEDLKNRENLLSFTCITIDPKNAKDFDDAVSCQKDLKGNFHLGVHIADVSHFIKPNSFLDKEAFQRGNSTYFLGSTVPMLPKKISNNLCSLKEKKTRLAISVLMEFDKKGSLLNKKILKSYIQVKKRFTYNEASSILQKKKKNDFFPLLLNMKELATILKKKRISRGSIDFSLKEIILQLDEKGAPLSVIIEPYDISHQMIEEFMLITNEAIAKYLHKKNISLIYRVHEKPSLETFQEFYEFARILGFKLPKNPDKKDLQNLFLQAKDTPVFHKLSKNFIKSMKTALYSEENIGHYGLSLEHYCHFTSPIRRYTDLIIHRLLFEEKTENLQKIAVHCSEKERNSFKAEISVTQIKKLRLLQKWFKKDKNRKYLAIITKISPYFVYFEIQELLLEGFLHISNFHDDYYEFNPHSMTLKGAHSKKIIKYGGHLKVKIKDIDLIKKIVLWQK